MDPGALESKSPPVALSDTAVSGGPSNFPSLLPVSLALLALIITFHALLAVQNRATSRASHLGTAIQYAAGSIDLLHPIIVGFNATETPTIQELPLWQAAAGLALKLAPGQWEGAANAVSLGLFVSCLLPLLSLARRFCGERAGSWALVFFLAQPLVFKYAGDASADGLAMVLSIWFMFFAERLIRTDSLVWWFPATFLAILTALTKLPFFMAAGLFAASLLLKSGSRCWRRWAALGACGVAAAMCFAAWNSYADAMAAKAEYPYVELRLSESAFIKQWFFGDLSYRLQPKNWVRGAWRFLHGTMGALPVVALLGFAVIKKGNVGPKLWLLGTLVTTLVFTHVVLEHWHYYLMCCPAVAMLCGWSLSRAEQFWTTELPPLMGICLAALALPLMTIQGMVAMKIPLDLDPYPRRIASLLAERTTPTDRLLVFQQDPNWGGEVLFRSHRQGLMVIAFETTAMPPTPKSLTDILSSKQDLARLRQLGYNKLVLISESPMRHAIEAANPGRTRNRRSYPLAINPEVDRWPVSFRSEDLLIKEIPSP